MKRNLHHITTIIIMLIAVIVMMKELPVQQVKAVAEAEKLQNNYLNVTNKYLYLGITGKDKFDFNIKKSVLKKDATYSWYIVEDKGNPKAITIDANTGMVTAESAGTAYIQCKITLADKKELYPEAEIVVINNITEVKIKNIPVDNKVIAGATFNFNQKIVNTTAGKGMVSSGITRWEIAKDTSEAGNVTEDGIVVPKKAGEFNIRALCFQRVQDYEFWLTNKASKDYLITAASDWVTITVLPTDGVAATQEQLDELLTSNNITQITISSEAEQLITIQEGNYSKKSLIVNAPNTDIKNYGEFKLITINSASETTWEENANNNSLEICDSIIHLVIGENYQVKSIEFDKMKGSTSTINDKVQSLQNSEQSMMYDFTTYKDNLAMNYALVSVNGKINDLNIIATSTINLTGTGKINQILIKNTAIGTKVATALTTDLKSYADFIITLFDGAQTIKIKSIEGTAQVENFSSYSVNLNIIDSNYISVEPNFALLIPVKGNTDYLTHRISYSSVIKLTPIAITDISATLVQKGQYLWNSRLSGGFSCKYVIVDGGFNWVTGDRYMIANGLHKWRFTPNDRSHFKIVYGEINVFLKE